MRPSRKPPTPKEELSGSLLLAHPALKEPAFRRAVVLLSSHSDEGAMGVVLNRPLGKTLAGLSPSLALSPLGSVPVFAGGPVQPDQLVLCAWQMHPGGEGFRLYFGVDMEKAAELQANEGMEIRAFLGYSGWGEGQLEGELERHTWVVTPVSGQLLDLPADESLWRGLLGAIDAEWRLLANEPDDPSVN
jgi:putative transcriptional regulator